MRNGFWDCSPLSATTPVRVAIVHRLRGKLEQDPMRPRTGEVKPAPTDGQPALAWRPAWFGVERVEQREEVECDG